MPIRRKLIERIGFRFKKSIEKVPLIIEGNIFFENTPIKNALVELIVQGENGQMVCHISKATTDLGGRFYCYTILPYEFLYADVNARVCVYSTPGPRAKPFPLFFGSKVFSLDPKQRHYNLSDINLHLGLSFCERPLIFKGQIHCDYENEFLYTRQTVRLLKDNQTVLSKTSVDIDGSFCIYTCADGLLLLREKVILEVSSGERAGSANILIEPDQHIYHHNISLN